MINVDNLIQMGYIPIMTYDDFVILKHYMADHFLAADGEGVNEVTLVKTLNFPISVKFSDEIIQEYSYCGELDNTCHKRSDEQWWATYAWFNKKEVNKNDESTN